MSDLYIDTDKGRLYIIGDNAQEIFVPPGCTIHVYNPKEDIPHLNIPPIIFDMSETDAKEIQDLIAKSVRQQVKIRGVSDDAEASI